MENRKKCTLLEMKLDDQLRSKRVSNHQSEPLSSQFLATMSSPIDSPIHRSYIITIPSKRSCPSSISKHAEDCGRRRDGVAARRAVGAVVRAVRGQHQRKETVRTYSGWFGSTSRGAEQRSRSTRAVCAAAVTRGILSRVSGLADVVARECFVENRSPRSVRKRCGKGIITLLARDRRKRRVKVRVFFRCSERKKGGSTKNDSTRSRIHLSRPSFQKGRWKSCWETDIPRVLCCLRAGID